MRPIKFRLYNQCDKRMYIFDPRWGNYGQGGGWVGGVLQEDYERDGRTFAPSNQWQLEPERCEWLQYTGLLDKNGVEIYEGDIIRDCNGLDVTWVIEWCEEEACFLGLDWCGNPNEVIGNIYSNKELLDGHASPG